MKRELEDEDEHSAKRRGGKKGGGKGGGGKGKGGTNGVGAGGLGPIRRFVFKLLCTDPLAANIIGHQGNVRKQLEDESGASLWISKRDELYPASRLRTLILHGDEASQVLYAAESVIPKLMEVAEKDRGRDCEPSEALNGKEDGEYIFRLALPAFCRGKLIGTKGTKIKDLREETGAKIFVDNDVFDGHHLVRLIGNQDKITSALSAIHEMVQEEVDTEDYERWAPVGTFHDSQKGGAPKGGGRYDAEPRPRSRERAPPPRDNGWGSEPPPSRGQPAHGYYEPAEERWEDQRRGRGNREAPHPDFGRAASMLQSLPSEFPEGTLDVDYAISFDLPNNRVGALIGRQREYVSSVEKTTGTRISFEEGPPSKDHDRDSRYRTIVITGPLMCVYAAHMMLMKKYHMKELEERKRAATPPPRGGSGPPPRGHGGGGGVPADIQDRIAELEEQLRDARRSVGNRR